MNDLQLRGQRLELLPLTVVTPGSLAQGAGALHRVPRGSPPGGEGAVKVPNCFRDSSYLPHDSGARTSPSEPCTLLP